MYCEKNFKTKKELKEAVAAGEKLRIFAPGLGKPKDNGIEYLSGPHYPEPHRWYAEVTMKDGIITKVTRQGKNLAGRSGENKRIIVIPRLINTV